tara:strand:- start:186 stop:332 length:147 start_codon:yes stop_codon:yes gene_type:complete
MAKAKKEVKKVIKKYKITKPNGNVIFREGLEADYIKVCDKKKWKVEEV